MIAWLEELERLQKSGTPSVLLTVAGVRGSTPRETGAKMVVTATETVGTIGGGQLEYQATRHAVAMLRPCEPTGTSRELRRYVLGANCGQCCGGVAGVFFEYLDASSADWLRTIRDHFDRRDDCVIATELGDGGGKWIVAPTGDVAGCPGEIVQTARSMLESNAVAAVTDDCLYEPIRDHSLRIAVFGAGHVGTATVDVLSRLACDIRWIDDRRNIFPDDVPPNVTPVSSANPLREVNAMPAGASYLVMTHSHPLDLDICATILGREDAAYCGLIGSRSKRRRFERMLKRQGLTDTHLASLTCPIGVSGIDGKTPAEIAIAVAAEILRTQDAAAGRQSADACMGAIA